MAIEFRCTRCNKLLRTADDTAGKHAKCPECGEILLIPAPEAPTLAPLSDADAGGYPPPPPPVGGSPFASNEPLQPSPQYQAETGNPYQSPSAYASETSRTNRTDIRPTIIDMNDVFSRAWAIFKDDWMLCIAAWAIVAACNFAFNMVSNQVVSRIIHTDPDFKNVPPQLLFQKMQEELPKIFLSGTLNGYINLLFTAWTFAGLCFFFLKIARGQHPSIGDLFSSGKFYLPMLGALFLYNIGMTIGLLCFIIPGILLALIFGQFSYLIIDRKMSIMEAFEMSKIITSGNRLTLFIIWIVEIGIVLAGFCALCVGVFAAIPFIILVNTVAYLAMTGQPTIDQYR